jgi:hypothetical protein
MCSTGTTEADVPSVGEGAQDTARDESGNPGSTGGAGDVPATEGITFFDTR